MYWVVDQAYIYHIPNTYIVCLTLNSYIARRNTNYENYIPKTSCCMFSYDNGPMCRHNFTCLSNCNAPRCRLA